MEIEKKEKRDQYWVMSRKNRYHGLEPLRRALADAGSPGEGMKIIHAAGTNGKGSTVNYIRAILNACGYRVGTFTSPHLSSHFDRIRFDDVWISEEAFNEYLDQNMEIILDNDLGMFEIDTLIALEWFADLNADYAVIEAGLGGRLDNTNAIGNTELSIITTVGLDHMNVLGERLSQIAFEKAGIIRHGGHCIYGYVDEACGKIIRAKAMREHAAAYPLPAYISRGKEEMEFRGNIYRVKGADYQKANAAMALEAARFLGCDISGDAVKKAVAECVWKGRFEQISENPDIILDGAHNEEGIRALSASLSDVRRPLAIVFSALRDKPGKRMAAILEETADLMIVTDFESERADTAENLAADNCLIIHDWRKALAEAEAYAGNGTVLITGSLYFISAVREALIK